MNSREDLARETQLLLQLVAKVKDLKILVAQESGVMRLKCPCGTVLLPGTPIISNLKDRQRGFLKSRIKDHLRTKHRVSEQTIRLLLSQAFAAD